MDPADDLLRVPNGVHQKLRCAGVTKSGKPCMKWALAGSRKCQHHQVANHPANIAKRAERLRDAVIATDENALRTRLGELVEPALEAVKEIIHDPTAKPEVRLKAAESILSRFVAPRMETKVTVTNEERDLDEELAALLTQQQANAAGAEAEAVVVEPSEPAEVPQA